MWQEEGAAQQTATNTCMIHAWQIVQEKGKPQPKTVLWWLRGQRY